MASTHEIADAIGRKRLADELHVGLTAVGNAVVRGVFPASWSRKIRALCNEAGVDCPDDLFNMRGYDTPNVDPAFGVQHDQKDNFAGNMAEVSR